MKSFLFFVLVLSCAVPLKSLALETDNYLVWGKTLEDSADNINSYLLLSIQKVLDKSNRQPKKLDCTKVSLAVADELKAFSGERNTLSGWIERNSRPSQIFPTTTRYLEQSIYRHPFRYYLKFVPLAPNIQVSNYYFGTDKLSHFASSGGRYFEHYIEKRKAGMSEIEAEKSSIQWGLNREATVLGFLANCFLN